MRARYEVQGWNPVQGEHRLARTGDLARATRIAHRRAGCVIDRDAADRIIYASRGYRRKVGVGGGGGGAPGGPSLFRLERGRLAQGHSGRGWQFGGRVRPTWLDEDGAAAPAEPVEDWEDDW